MKRFLLLVGFVVVSSAGFAATPAQQFTLLSYLPWFASLLGLVIVGIVFWYRRPHSQSAPARFELGRDYLRLDHPQPTTTQARIEIAHIFHYASRKSYLLAPLIQRWAREQKSAVELVPIPQVDDERSQLYAKAFFTSRALNRTGTLHGALFDAIHLARRQLDSEDRLAQFFSDHGIDPVAFRHHFNSSSTQTALNKAQVMLKGYSLKSVPALIVNGTYLVTEEMAGSQPRLMEILDFLSASELRA